MNKKLTVVVLLLAASVTCRAQVSLTGTSYLENFNSMASTTTYGTTGWTGIRSAGTGTIDATLVPAVDNGGSTTGGVFNYGTAAAADRALGELASAATIPAFGAVFTNNTGSTITSLTISFTEEQWHAGSSSAVNEVWTFQYKPAAVAITNAAFTSPSVLSSLNLTEIQTGTTTAAALDGNAAANRANVSGTITGLSIASGTTIAFRWVDTDNTGSDAGMAIDDFNMTFGLAAVPEPSTFVAGVLSVLALLGMQRRRHLASTRK